MLHTSTDFFGYTIYSQFHHMPFEKKLAHKYGDSRNPGSVTITFFSRARKILEQECIPVGCVPTTAVTTTTCHNLGVSMRQTPTL